MKEKEVICANIICADVICDVICADLLLTEFIVLLREMFLGKEKKNQETFSCDCCCFVVPN